MFQQPNSNGGMNPLQMMRQFQQFQQNFQKQFPGDPQQVAPQIVQQLLNSGQMSQQTFNALSQQATEFQNFFAKFKN